MPISSKLYEMNWWKQVSAKQTEALDWKQLGKGFGVGVATMGLGVLPFVKSPDKEVIPQVSVQTELPIKEPEKSIVPSTEVTLPKTEKPSVKTEEKPQQAFVDISKIIEIESSGRENAVSGKGAAGLMQVMPKTWEDIAAKIGKYQGFDQWKFDRKANVEIGSYYMNTEIPRMLKAFNIPDTVEFRLAAYNWGIGNVKNTYKKYGRDWKNHLPEETSSYLRKYFGT